MDIIEENREYVSNDILDGDFVNTFLPIYRLQFIMGSCRVQTKHTFVYPPTLLQKCYTLLSIIVTGGSMYAVIPLYFDLQPEKSVTYLGILLLLCINIASFCSVMHVRFLNGRQNSEFHLKIRKLDKLMRIDKRKAINSSLKRINNVSVILILIAYFWIVLQSFLARELRAFIFIGMGISYFSFIVEVIVCSNILVYFFIRVRFVNCLMESYLQIDENVRKQIKWSGASEKCIRSVAKDTDSCFTTSDVHIYLKEIFSCFAKYQELYRFQIHNHIQLSIILVVFMIIELLQAVLLAFRFGIFFTGVKETKRLCIAVMALHQTGLLRDKAKTMLGMIEKTPPRFSVYDMWDINAGMFVTMFSVVTSLIVTQIQLAFL